MKPFFAIIIFAIFLISCSQQTDLNFQQKTNQTNLIENFSKTIEIENNSLVTPIENSEVAKEFKIEAFQHGYEPNEIRVAQGDKVRSILTTRDVGHSLNIAEYGLNVPAQLGTPGEKEFIADKKGIFTWRCRIPCGYGHQNMTGTLIVE